MQMSFLCAFAQGYKTFKLSHRHLVIATALQIIKPLAQLVAILLSNYFIHWHCF